MEKRSEVRITRSIENTGKEVLRGKSLHGVCLNSLPLCDESPTPQPDTRQDQPIRR